MRKLLLLLLYFFISTTSNAQRLTLPELISLSEKQNWESVNTTLLAKGWVYYDSKKGDSENYNTITWSFNKEHFSDKANGWFYLYTYEGHPNKVAFTVFNKPSYLLIQNALSSSGFKLTNSAIEDNEVVSTYSNIAFIVKITTQKREDDDWSDRSLTAYRIILIKKSGVYDPNNGKKKDFYENGEVKSEYTLKNGKLHGPFTYFHEDGKLKKKGAYSEGNLHGKFVEYDSTGSKVGEYFMASGEINGLAILYNNGLKSSEKEFVNGIETGKYVEYIYDEDNELVNKVVGTMNGGEKEGKWLTYLVQDGKNDIVETINFRNGLKHGFVEEYINQDTIETAYYSDGELNGPYKRKIRKNVYIGKDLQLAHMWALDAEGEYKAGLKYGKWTIYDFGTKQSQGHYADDKKEGKWLDYLLIGKNQGQVFSEATFVNDQKNGLYNRYFNVEIQEDATASGITKYFKNTPIKETSNFKNNKKHGAYELKDSTGIILSKGNYVNDSRHGSWIESSLIEVNSKPARFYFKGEYQNDKEEGKWVVYQKENQPLYDMTYNNGQLHGESTIFTAASTPLQRKKFNRNKLVEMGEYDSLGLNIINKYEILEEGLNSFKCRETLFNARHITSQEFWLKKEKEEIDHNSFLFDFQQNTGKLSDGLKGYRDGVYTITTPVGEILVIGKYLKNSKVGHWTYRYPEQNVTMELNFENGQMIHEKFMTLTEKPFNGEFKLFDQETNTKQIIKIKNGLRNGKTAYLDNNNKIIKKESFKEGVLK